ncbi:BRCT domain-containing protein [Aeromonas media]|uniref:BRCT domain-containing protein n=1 Tax=Aeromonas caviae TaxID=648 RepID=A0AAW9F5D1_AERCA|nr:BRCT domain-containing protein [Aeromonas caviae]MDX7720812.1 BRCT domain-containing protein [Aeromonas caviae]
MPEFYDVPVAFCYKRNKQKALIGLHGILSGLTADQRLNETEVLFLSTWLKSDVEFKKDGDFLDIQEAIRDALEDGVFTSDEKDDLLTLLNDVLQYNEIEHSNMGALVNMLLGFLQGISADSNIVEAEVLALSALLLKHRDLLASWPGSLLFKRLNDILADGVITEEERDDLLELTKQITGQRFTDSGLATGMATEFFADGELTSLHGKRVCFTGKFLSDTRFNLEQQAKVLGAEPVRAMSQKVNVLIIGSLASRDWMFTSHGRKIEAAIKAKDEGCDIQIINEDDWVRIALEPIEV